MNEIDIAWAAGLFEGEGSFSATRPRGTRRPYLRATMQSMDRDVLERFQEVIGFGSIYTIRPDPRLSHGRPIYQWACASEAKFILLLDMIGPHLGVRRRQRAAELLARHGSGQERLCV